MMTMTRHLLGGAGLELRGVLLGAGEVAARQVLFKGVEVAEHGLSAGAGPGGGGGGDRCAALQQLLQICKRRLGGLQAARLQCRGQTLHVLSDLRADSLVWRLEGAGGGG